MQQMVQYNVNINCDSCPEGNESQIVDRLKSVFPVVSYRRTGNGFTMRLDANHPVADGALKDFADVVAETLTGLGIRMTSGVVRQITRRAPSASGAMGRVQDVAASLTGFDLRPVREVPVLYFYKGLRFDLDVTTRLAGIKRPDRIGAP